MKPMWFPMSVALAAIFLGYTAFAAGLRVDRAAPTLQQISV